MEHNFRQHSSYTPQKSHKTVFLGSFIHQINESSVFYYINNIINNHMIKIKPHSYRTSLCFTWQLGLKASCCITPDSSSTHVVLSFFLQFNFLSRLSQMQKNMMQTANTTRIMNITHPEVSTS